MKTKTLTIGKKSRAVAVVMILFAITTISFSQVRNSKIDWLKNAKVRFIHNSETENIFRTVLYHETIEAVNTPAITRTIHTGYAEVIYEETMTVENWMTAPFETSTEENVAVENWMTAPFDAAIEKPVKIEDWMTSPFGTSMEASVLVEDWMTAPFEYTAEASLESEQWISALQIRIN